MERLEASPQQAGPSPHHEAPPRAASARWESVAANSLSDLTLGPRRAKVTPKLDPTGGADVRCGESQEHLPPPSRAPILSVYPRSLSIPVQTREVDTLAEAEPRWGPLYAELQPSPQVITAVEQTHF